MKYLLLIPALCSAACLEPSGPRITAADLARAVPAFGALPAGLELSFAPQPGHVRVFPPAELKGRLARTGVEYTGDETICFEWPMETLDAAAVVAAMEQSLPQGSQLKLPESLPQVPKGKVVFEAAGLSRGARTWRGHIEYAPGLRYSLSLPVEVQAPFRRVVAAVPLRIGERITADRLRVEEGVGAPIDAGSLESIEVAVGMVPKRLIPAGAPVLRQVLGEARAIVKGDPVQVTVVSGSARLQLDAVAQQHGTIGSPVAVRVQETGRIIHPRLEENGRATLDVSARMEN